jgi:pimeloyl-ACP methyl ester carboxylesterase
MEHRELRAGGELLHVAYRDEGEGPAVVLLHGQPGSAATWGPVSERLRAHARVIAPDRPGYGASGGPARGIAENAEAAIALLDELGIERATFVGHSWGGGVALAAAVRDAARVAGLVLVASTGTLSSIDPLDRVLVLPGLGPALTRAGFLAMPRLLPLPPVRRRLVRELGMLPTSSVDEVVRQIRRRDWRAFVVEQRALVREIGGLAARLPEVDTPAIVLGGRLDFMLPPRVVRELAATLPHAALRILPGAGHVIPVEDPDAVAAAALELAR